MSTITSSATTRPTTRTWRLFAPPATTLANECVSEPLRWRKPQRVGINGDLFHEDVPDEYIDRVFAVMALASRHTFQVLTKRPERMRAYVSDMGRHYMGEVDGEYMERWGDAAVELTGDPCSAGGPIEDCGWPLPNVWLGTSVEDQVRANERIPELLATPAAVRFLSCEPLLGAVDLQRVQPDWLPKEEHPHDPILRLDALQGLITGMDEYVDWDGGGGRRSIDWVIVGGESGPGARPCDIGWVRGLVGQCQAAGVAMFVKQDSGPKPGRQGRISDDLWLKEFPNAR